MSENTKIEWADHSWSPWRGCTKVSPGCLHCYAETLAKRNPAVLGGWGKGAARVLAKNWQEPIRWQKRTAMDMPHPRVFPSLCDWLDDEIPVEWLGRFLHLIEMTPHIDWLLLTKRPQLFRTAMEQLGAADVPWSLLARRWLRGEAPGNVWFGVSVEDQTRANERIPILLEIPARLRWLSVEPMLGEIEMRPKWLTDECDACGRPMPRNIEGCWNPRTGDDDCDGSRAVLPKVDWVVVGGESGHSARPCHVEWIRSIVGDCTSYGVPVFVKQLGANPHCECGELPANGQTGWHPKGGDPAEWPDDLRVRQFPEANRLNTDIR